MSFTKRFKETMQNVAKKIIGDVDFRKIYHSRMIEFRKNNQSVVKLAKPTNLTTARRLGYKAKQGVFVVRVKVRRGSGNFIRPNKGRNPKRLGVNKLTRRISIQRIAEQRASSKYSNAEVLNSYWIGEDSKNKYFEVILIDKHHPVVLSNKNLKNASKKNKRAERGLTSAGKKNRGLIKKGIGTEKNRPSLRRNNRKAK